MRAGNGGTTAYFPRRMVARVRGGPTQPIEYVTGSCSSSTRRCAMGDQQRAEGAQHGCNLSQDEGRWDIAECDCGWMSPPCPDPGIAADFYADHYLEANS